MKQTAFAPGKSYREGITIIGLMDMFPTEDAATAWFESVVWPSERCCGHCGSVKTREVPNRKPMPYWCSDCRSYFSVRTGTALERTKVPLRKWAIAIYLELTSLKSISSMKLHRDIGVRQSTAWFMLHRIRESWTQQDASAFAGPVEADETFVGGKERNKHEIDRTHDGRGPVGKIAVAGVKDRASGKVRAEVVPDTTGATLRGFVTTHTQPDAMVYSDGEPAYASLPQHEAVKHSVGEYVRGMAHTNGMESFWSMLKRAHMGTFHKLSPKHLDRYVQAFAGKHNVRDADTLAQMIALVAGLVGKRLMYRDLIAENGLSSGARS